MDPATARHIERLAARIDALERRQGPLQTIPDPGGRDTVCSASSDSDTGVLTDVSGSVAPVSGWLAGAVADADSVMVSAPQPPSSVPSATRTSAEESQPCPTRPAP